MLPFLRQEGLICDLTAISRRSCDHVAVPSLVRCLASGMLYLKGVPLITINVLFFFLFLDI